MNECKCDECKTRQHDSDCAVHNEPATPKGNCDCDPWNGWISVDNYLPEVGKYVLIYGPEEQEIAEYTENVEDSIDVMGYDAGWISMGGFAFPGRTFGNPEYIQPAHGQPTHWQPLPPPPTK